MTNVLAYSGGSSCLCFVLPLPYRLGKGTALSLSAWFKILGKVKSESERRDGGVHYTSRMYTPERA